jgi:hypothetical protein
LRARRHSLLEVTKNPCPWSQGSRSVNALHANLTIRRGEQPQIDDMHRIEAGSAQGSCERGRKLSVDDEQQNLFRGNNRMVNVTSCERERGIDICAFEIRIVEKNCLPRLAIREQA